MNSSSTEVEVTHTLEIRVQRWATVTISDEHLRNLLADRPTDEQHPDETVMDWVRRNAGEATLRQLIADHMGREMSGVTWLPDQVHTLTAMDGRVWVPGDLDY